MNYKITIKLDKSQEKRLENIASLADYSDSSSLLEELINTGLKKEIWSLLEFVEKTFSAGKSGAMSSSL